MASFTYTTTNEGKVKLLAEALGARGHACSLTRNEDAPGDLMAGGARPFHLRVDSAEAEAALRRLLSPAGDSVGPLPLVPASDLLAERDRLLSEVERLRELNRFRLAETGRYLEAYKRAAEQKTEADERALQARASLRDVEEQRDALANLLARIWETVPAEHSGPAVARHAAALNEIPEALRKAGR